jgi:hypothetical protein
MIASTSFKLYAQQNLVPNPSFEIFSSCPNGLNSGSPDELIKATGWCTYRETPDYYNNCANQTTAVSIPDNFCGYQLPASGNGYVGFQAYFTTDFREVLGCQLTSTLIIGQKYFVTFKVVNAGAPGTFGTGFNCCTNKIGARFSTVPNTYSNPTAINNIANVYTDSIIKDTISWFTISGSFIADSNYQYIAIGNFFDDANTDTLKFNTSACRAYYLVDHICVSTDSLYAANWEFVEDTFQNPIHIFPNPTYGIMNVSFQGDIIPTISLYNSIGETIVIKAIVSQNDIELNLSELSAGVYYLYAMINEEHFFQKIILIK